ncbi:uncharacterized protein LOC100678540 [Nasonia vitripennis]|uniref:Protein sleepless n=1 Tax=Nasonia vitripennis TaxID=7425 RepID=A0A7M7GN34_NASVI|nr:uncharacterized protein LOC100678540 [Nasonia vitripennis]
MSISKSVIALALCFLLSTESVFSKVEKCYQCDSATDVDCALNRKQEKFIFNCKDTPTGEGFFNLNENIADVEFLCVKAIITKSFFGNKTLKMLVHGCGTKDTCNEKPDPKTGITLVECNTCTSDLCNSS